VAKSAAKLGGVLYVCWGLLHFTAAYGVFNLAQNSPAMAQARLMQTAFYLTAFATAAIIFAITLNWRNDRFGFWVNAVMVGSQRRHRYRQAGMHRGLAGGIHLGAGLSTRCWTPVPYCRQSRGS